LKVTTGHQLTQSLVTGARCAEAPSRALSSPHVAQLISLQWVTYRNRRRQTASWHRAPPPASPAALRSGPEQHASVRRSPLASAPPTSYFPEGPPVRRSATTVHGDRTA